MNAATIRMLGLGMLAAAVLAASGCCHPWMGRAQCGHPWMGRARCGHPWMWRARCGGRACLRGLSEMAAHRPRLIPDTEPQPPRSRYHPVPTDNVFAPRHDTFAFKAKPSTHMPPFMQRTAPYPVEPQLQPPQPPPEILPDPSPPKDSEVHFREAAWRPRVN